MKKLFYITPLALFLVEGGFVPLGLYPMLEVLEQFELIIKCCGYAPLPESTEFELEGFLVSGEIPLLSIPWGIIIDPFSLSTAEYFFFIS